MNRKQKKKDAREQSTRQLMGIDDITDYPAIADHLEVCEHLFQNGDALMLQLIV